MDDRKATRREVLVLLGASGLAATMGCGGGETSTSPSSTSGGTSSGSGGACAIAPTETLGPYPSLAGLVRSDIREGRSGLSLVLTITVVNANNACGPVAGAQVDVWAVRRGGPLLRILPAGLRRQG